MPLVDLPKLQGAIERAGARVVRAMEEGERVLAGHVALSIDDRGVARWHRDVADHPGATHDLIAVGATAAVDAWERAERPYRLRTFTAANFDRDVSDPEPWGALGDGRRALLFVHGTFGRAHEVFDVGEETMRALEAKYDGRVFAFDHFTLSDDPARNVEIFLRGLGDGACDLDVICHSRGGIVARLLAVAAPERVRIGRFVFVGSPNDGTALADPDLFSRFVDVYTNLFVEHALDEALVGVVHLVATKAEDVCDRLPGVVAQRPGSEILSRLRDSLPPGDRSFGVASDFASDGSRASLAIMDRVADAAFRAPNDLAVPVASVSDVGSNAFVPSDHRLLFGNADAVHHFAYFRRPETRDRLLRWL